MLTAISGYKTYIVAAALILYEVLGYLLGKSPTLDVRTILEGAGLATLRAAITKVTP